MARRQRRSSQQPNSPIDPAEIREQLMARFKGLPQRERAVMLDVQAAVRRHVAVGVSLVDELSADRRREE